jgi:hypothetical protein
MDPRARWTSLHLAAGPTADTGSLTTEPAHSAGSVTLDARSECATFTHRFDRDTELVGPMALRLLVELPRGGDVSVFATVRKSATARSSPSKAPTASDAVTHGMLAASLRAVDPDRFLAGRAYHPYTRVEPLAPGETVALDIELVPAATLFRDG